ncbi:arrestin [Microdochium trichocladiopsis]|uniref:Arrestin n=1 Tax=Microdochium trichocladiopsis TaxID=1682393 RepID=A0A9P8YEU7_9PEZI|nr:arrestin [Microdochium trichocladiopsis]KAH7035703.1 arrestin [Microdochium trichocladiopsis]
MSGRSLSDRSVATAAGSKLFSGYVRRLSLFSKPDMDIHIDNHFHQKVYSTASPIAGHVSITCAADTPFDRVNILLLGIARSRIDGVNIPQITEHTFLKLEMPIPAASYPVPRVLEAGATYKIPFHFIIPQALTTSACNHRVVNGAVHEHHTRLPPSMGAWDRDDLAPAMAQVDYTVRARLLRDDAAHTAKVFEISHPINVLPQADEDAPLSVSPKDAIYAMSKTKTLRKSILSAKTGVVTVSATQPPPAMASVDGRSVNETSVSVDLQFEPANAETLPPKVAITASKITAQTFWSASGVASLPNLGDGLRYQSDGRGSFPATVNLASAAAQEHGWTQHNREQARRDSGYGSETASDSEGANTKRSSKKAAAKKASPVYHSTRVQVPVTLPAHKKMFIPTFHSCIVSRVYVLNLSVTLTSGNGSTVHTTLSVPLQIGVVAPTHSRATVDATGLPTFEAAINDAEVDDFLRPRVLSVPTVEFVHDALPGYADISGARPVAAH